MLVSICGVILHFSNVGSKAKLQSAQLVLRPTKLHAWPDALQMLISHAAPTSARHDLAIGLQILLTSSIRSIEKAGMTKQ